MKSNELRIGNLVEYNGEVVSIKGITEEHPFIDMITIDYLDYDELRPIRLTGERLLKFGFEKLVGWDDMVYFNNNGIHIYLCKNDKEDWFEYENDIVIRSVHQLQNLYFTLKEMELSC